jgi:hypothetical protein
MAELPTVQVFKSATCGCCIRWISHLQEHGFTVTATDVGDMSKVKVENDVPPQLYSCHTALIDGYVIEGHVPAPDIMLLLAERPEVSGLAVPGMPIGSPGMEGPNSESYKVMSFDDAGTVREFATHHP